MGKDKKGKTLFHRYLPNKNGATSIAVQTVNHIYEDSKKNTWIASSNGLSKYVKETDSFISVSSKDGLPSDFIEFWLSITRKATFSLV